MKCRGCGEELSLTFLNLGVSPIANDLIAPENVNSPETFFPLHPMTCTKCALVQLPEIASRESLFRSDYVYFSSYSTSWLAHCKAYAESMVGKLSLNSSDLVVEIASNDGYLLQYFKDLEIGVLGVEPSSGVAQVAESVRGIPTKVEFFGVESARKLLIEGIRPRLMVANNVLAHVPNLQDFIEGFAILIEEDGVITFEFPHLNNLIAKNQFDTIYHEHYSYLSLTALAPIFERNGLRIFDVSEFPTHGGSIRVSVCKQNAKWRTESTVSSILDQEKLLDPRIDSVTLDFQSRALAVKYSVLKELSSLKITGSRIAAYGAAAKGNTLLNFVGIDADTIDYVVDLNPAKQGKYLPGSRIPIVGESRLSEDTPDVLLILPWNIVEEVQEQLTFLKDVGVRFLRAIPELEYF